MSNAKPVLIARKKMSARDLVQCVMSTRSNANEDAHRDFDDFDQDEELRRFREAVRSGQWRAAAVLATNIDESLSRCGSLPAAWIGPRCMERGIERRHSMSATDIDRVVGGFVRADEIPET